MTTQKEALPRRKKKADQDDQLPNGTLLRKRYRSWLRNTVEGQAEREAMQERIVALRATWERKGI